MNLTMQTEAMSVLSSFITNSQKERNTAKEILTRIHPDFDNIVELLIHDGYLVKENNRIEMTIKGFDAIDLDPHGKQYKRNKKCDCYNCKRYAKLEKLENNKK